MAVGQVPATGGLDDGVGDDGHVRQGVQKFHQNFEHGRVAQRAGFHCMDWHVACQAGQLLANQVGINRLGAVDIVGVLDGKAGEYRQWVRAQGRNGLDVGLNAGTT